ncbi:MAG: acetamidase/formamidase family protein, partial [Muribaculaceae bacterium]|nr:acetamidase/formamidase family protein [Muribaculaceae bacterium]
VYVEGAEPGDILKVEILDIRLARQGVMVDGPGRGVTGRALTEQTIKIFPISDGQLVFNDTLSFPLRPMIGVIGPAPAGAGVDTGAPGAHGGNMDCALVGIGAVLYLPVNVKCHYLLAIM